MFEKFISLKIIIALIFVCSATSAGLAQTTAFNYQGRLTEAGSPANGSYQLQFKLYDAASGGTKIGATVPDVAVTAAQGVFTTQLDFGVLAFTGADRFLEIGVRHNAGESYTILSPRQQITSSPYSIRTLSAAQADIALDAIKLGGVDASQYVTTATVGSSFIKNGTTLQTGNFNISGNGMLGAAFQANTVTARTGTGFYGLTQTDGTTSVATYIGGSSSGASGGWFGTVTNHPLHFFTNGGQSQMTINTAGNVGIGTTTPQAKLHVAGNTVQDRSGGGMIKAMLSVRADGTIERCYNGVTGTSTLNCGFSVAASQNGNYAVNLGFQVTDRFLSVTARGINGSVNFPPTPMSADFRFSTLPNSNANEVFIDTFRPDTGATQNSAFMLIVY